MTSSKNSPITNSIVNTLTAATTAGFINTEHFEDHLAYELQVTDIDPELVLNVFRKLPINILSMGLKSGFEGALFKEQVYTFISKRRAKFTAELRKINANKEAQKNPINDIKCKIDPTENVCESSESIDNTAPSTDLDTDENEHAFYLPSLPKEVAKFGKKSSIRQLYFDLDVISLTYSIDKPFLSLSMKKWPSPEIGNIKIEQEKRKPLIDVMASHEFIFGRFLVSKEKKMCARIRETIKGDQKQYQLTIKAPGRSLTNRKEFNIKISSHLFNKLAELNVTHPTIEKTRYKINVDDDNGYMWEIDQFTAPFSFVKAECEVNAPDSPAPETPGHWEAIYVTGQRQFDNDFICTATEAPIPNQLNEGA